MDTHPIKGFSHLHAIKLADLRTPTVKGLLAIQNFGEQGPRKGRLRELTSAASRR